MGLGGLTRWGAARPLLAFAALVLLPDAALRATRGRIWDAAELVAYVVAAGASAVLWVALAGALSRLRARWALAAPPRRRSGRALAWGVGAVLGFFTYSVLGYWLRLGVDPQPSELAFFVSYPRYAAAIIGENTDLWPNAVLWAGTVATSLALELLTRRPCGVPGRPLRVMAAAALAVVALAAVWLQMPAPPDLRGVAWGLRTVAYVAAGDRYLPEPARAPLPALQARARPNVLVLLHESLTAEVWAPWSPDAPDSPRTAAFLAARPERTVWFPHANANTSATNIAVPALLTGLESDAAREAYAAAPLLWHYGRALGYRTAFFSAQSLAWANLDRFLLGADAPDAVVTAESSGAPRVNDAGVDDALLVTAFERLLAETPRDVPFLAVVQLNATHMPAYGGPEAPPVPEGAPWLAHYLPAARYADRIAGDVLDLLGRDGRLDDTFVVSTADHGEYLDDVGKPPRSESLEESVAWVPLWLHLPRALATEEARAAIASNRETRVCNLDVLPTLLDAWGLWETLSEAPGARFGGHSLFGGIPPERLIVATSVAPIRPWDRSDLAFYRGDAKWLVQARGTWVFDLARDPHGLDGRPLELGSDEGARFLDELASRPALRDAYRRTRPGLASRLEELRDLALSRASAFAGPARR